MEGATELLPLSAIALHILLVLAAAELHGYGIKLEIERQSGGQYRPGPGTLYDNIERLAGQGVIEPVQRNHPDEDPRRRYYRITRYGRRALAAEVARLESLVTVAKRQLAKGGVA